MPRNNFHKKRVNLRKRPLAFDSFFRKISEDFKRRRCGGGGSKPSGTDSFNRKLKKLGYHNFVLFHFSMRINRVLWKVLKIIDLCKDDKSLSEVKKVKKIRENVHKLLEFGIRNFNEFDFSFKTSYDYDFKNSFSEEMQMDLEKILKEVEDLEKEVVKR